MDENSVSDEVRALLERIEQFPHEFYGPQALWKEEFMDTFCCDMQTPLSFLLTAEEFRLLKQAYRILLRKTFSEEVIEKIINPKQTGFYF